MHSGCNGGKKWRIQVTEKFGVGEAVIFDSKLVAEKRFGKQTSDCVYGFRPQRAIDLLEDWLFEQPTFNYEDHSLYVNSKWFSLNSIGEGLRKIGEFFNKPLVEKK